MTETKICYACKEEFPVTEFYKDTSRGLHLENFDKLKDAQDNH